ncbi:hypothetical protein [Catenuloplanes indicus]|uniref:Uncharacterized protein n=1 Tax=Catenuloplanes indicus TaxID=137267 RepID=A0AAE3VTJ7_9ACTN|nr:hypothetical protein [Catenuloplanes indicus]MDQ0363365.1 hypothetical protein [Catenuloplanes indicus]MDQ0371687.1 hypothetical protein [Catenuloplanes indicus]
MTAAHEAEPAAQTAEELLAEFGRDGLDATTEPVLDQIVAGEWPAGE